MIDVIIVMMILSLKRSIIASGLAATAYVANKLGYVPSIQPTIPNLPPQNQQLIDEMKKEIKG